MWESRFAEGACQRGKLFGKRCFLVDKWHRRMRWSVQREVPRWEVLRGNVHFCNLLKQWYGIDANSDLDQWVLEAYDNAPAISLAYQDVWQGQLATRPTYCRFCRLCPCPLRAYDQFPNAWPWKLLFARFNLQPSFTRLQCPPDARLCFH